MTRTLALAAIAFALAVASAACTSDQPAPAGSGQPIASPSDTPTNPVAITPTPTASTSGTPTASVSDSPAARQALAALAAKAADAEYDATYDFDAPTTGSKGSLRIVAAPPSFRLDVVSGPRTAQYYDIGIGTVACAVPVSGASTCLLVAKPGQPVPDLFNPGVRDLFTTGLQGLSEKPDDYAVEALADSTAAAGRPVGKCFAVERQTDLRTPKPGEPPVPGQGFETGEYCFDPGTGVLIGAKVTSGRITLKTLGPKPDAADFKPPSEPGPLPSSLPTPSGTPSS